MKGSSAANETRSRPMHTKWVFNLGYLLAALLLIGTFEFWLSYRAVAQLSYSDALQAAQDGRIASVVVIESLIEGEFKHPEEGKKYFVAHRVDPSLAEVFEKAGAKVSGWTDSNWAMTLLSWIFPLPTGRWSLIARIETAGQQSLKSIWLLSRSRTVCLWRRSQR